MRLFRRRRRKPYPRALRFTWFWLLVLLAVSPRLLGAIVAVLVLGAALFAVWHPGQRAGSYYKILALVSLALCTFVNVMLLLGAAI